MQDRDYNSIAAALRSDPSLAAASKSERMRTLIDALWDALSTLGISWIGIYLEDPGAPEEQGLVLECRRDTPACSPIGLRGVCGSAYTTNQIQIIKDVNNLGANYIACDPRDRSEIVLPLLDDAGNCWGVLDVDSWDVASFDDHDAAGLADALAAAGFRTAPL